MSHSSHLNLSSNLNTPGNRRSQAFSSNRSNQVGASLVKKESSSDLLQSSKSVSGDALEQQPPQPAATRKGKVNHSVVPNPPVRKARITHRADEKEAMIPVATAMEVSDVDSSDDVHAADEDYESTSVTSDQLMARYADSLSNTGNLHTSSYEDSTDNKAFAGSMFSIGVPSSQLTSSQINSSTSSGGLSKDKILAAKEKNREHAKNTRLRKKNYIESLKQSIKELSDEREKHDREKKHSMNKIMEQTTIRKKNLQEVLSFRCNNVQDHQLWSKVVDEQIVLVLPITPYRSFPPSQVFEGQRIVRGIENIVVDAASMAVMLQSTITPTNTCDTKIEAEFICNFQDSVMSEDTFMCKWEFATKNAMACGCRSEVVVHGMLKAMFSPVDNKLTYLEEIFDVMSIMQQLRRASGKHDFSVIPNTMSLAQDFSNECRVVVDLQTPFNVVYANENWCNAFQTSTEGMVGQNLESILLQLHGNKPIKADKMAEIRKSLQLALPYCSFLPVFSDQEGRKRRIFIRMLPLYSKGHAVHSLVSIEKHAADQASLPSFQFSELPVNFHYESQMQSGSSYSDSTHSPTTSQTTKDEETDSTSQHSSFVIPHTTTNSANNRNSTSSPLTMANQIMDNETAAEGIDSNLGVEEEDSDMMQFNPQNNTSEEFLFGLLNDFTKENNNQELDNMVIDLDQPSLR